MARVMFEVVSSTALTGDARPKIASLRPEIGRLTAALFILAVSVALLTLCTSAHAQATKDAKAPLLPVQIIHTPPKADVLPYPGQPVELRVLLANTRDFRDRLRVFTVMDGSYLEIAPTKSYLNEYDQPTYDVTLISPIGEVSYFFTLQLSDGRIVSSPKYTIRRSCLPNVEAAELIDISNLEARNQLLPLLEQSNALNNDLNSLERAISLVQEITTRIEKKK